MTIVVTSSNDNTIAIPAWLMKALNLHDGTAVKATIDGQTLNLSPLAEFLALRGVFSDDDTFEQAIHSLDQQWESWSNEHSV
ncbi:MAG TPA: hypothetical protein P5121_20065 [Caldilineaceae bacterium]|nr:hypothetical protein [Caldilineaceae bacterium]